MVAINLVVGLLSITAILIWLWQFNAPLDHPALIPHRKSLEDSRGEQAGATQPATGVQSYLPVAIIPRLIKEHLLTSLLK
jgi:hypothetical protein